uniref:Proline-rich protein 3-like n=1 Tax=Lotus japonicus TaxID=34305 RepID=I3TAG1_LOTJA|nr:unknown [Lotus japonicus]
MKMASIHFFVLSFMLFASLFLTGSFATVGDYGSEENVTKKPKLEDGKLLSSNIAIQGLVYCKSGSKLIPLEGALTRITCVAADEYGFETTPLSFLSEATDTKGYFLATMCPLDVAEKRVLKECRAFLEASPWNNCSDPSDINKGISGAVLHSYRFLHDKNMNLYTVGPFLFTSSP